MSTASDPTTDTSTNQRIGKLAAIGLEHPWQAALFMPSSYLDCRDADRSALTLDKKQKAAIRLTICSPFRFCKGPPRTQFSVEDSVGERFKATMFGDYQEWKDKVAQGESHLFLATAHEFSGMWSVTVHEVLPSKYAGRIIPNYPAPRTVIEPPVLRAAVARLLPQALPAAARHIENQLTEIAPLPVILEALNASGWTLEQLLQQAHYPADSIYIDPVRLTLQRLAALGSLASARARREKRPNPIELQSLDKRIQQLPFDPTEDQLSAIRDVATDLSHPSLPAHRCIAGDVGVGKTAVAGVIAAAAADAAKKTVVLFPSSLVAVQAHAEFKKWFPDLPIALVTGDTGGHEDLGAPVLMGTHALLHRDVGHVDVAILDEQHRWSREQREHYRGPGTHLIELSATCIPRTQALVRFGHMSVTEMRQTHLPKFIETRLLVGREQARDLMLELRHVIRGGSPVFVVYPKRELGEDVDDRKNLQAAAEIWERVFPGLVQTLDGTDSAEHKSAAIEAVRNGTKPILLCTTVVEVGVDVASLRHIVVVEPGRYGLSQLHQLRGRVARAGGEGWCYLLAPDGLSPETRDRLQPFLETTDGFKIAEADLRHRGAGDLSADSQRQHGADGNFLHGMKIDLEVYDEVLPLLTELQAA